MTQALHALLSDAGIAVPLGLANPGLEAITTDSRRVGSGTLFLGLPGERVDGGTFWPELCDVEVHPRLPSRRLREDCQDL